MIETLSCGNSLNYGSHLPALMACTAVCEGPVLEIGCGHFSTPCLHALCSALKLPLVTTETQDSWREQFLGFATPTHSLVKQTKELLADFAKQKWGLVFVDDEPHLRLDHFNEFFNSARFVLFHDANFPDYKNALAKWLVDHECHHRFYTKYGPHTMAVSKTHPIPEFE